mgnify:CR=1 FL=1
MEKESMDQQMKIVKARLDCTTFYFNVNDDPDVEGTETVQINLISATSPVTIGTASATINNFQ